MYAAVPFMAFGQTASLTGEEQERFSPAAKDNQLEEYKANRMGSLLQEGQTEVGTSENPLFAAASSGRGHTIVSTADFSVINGGYLNVASGRYSSIGGGGQNQVRSNFAAVLGGFRNVATGRFAAVLGGARNTASARRSLAAGFAATAKNEYSAALGFNPDKPCETSKDGEFRICAKSIVFDGRVMDAKNRPISTIVDDAASKETFTDAEKVVNALATQVSDTEKMINSMTENFCKATNDGGMAVCYGTKRGDKTHSLGYVVNTIGPLKKIVEEFRDFDDCLGQPINPCKNGGTCYDAGIAKFNCTCTYGWGGDDCTTNLLPPTSCREYLDRNPGAKTGWYDMETPKREKYRAYCEMEKNGGGWTRMLQLNGARKNCKLSFRSVALETEIVGDYCSGKEFTFSRSMMIDSNHELMFTDDQNRMMYYKFTDCASKQCTCDRADPSDRGLCFFLAVTADYSGGAPLMSGDNYDFFCDAWNWGANKWENEGDGHCGGTNANAHSQWNCEPAPEKGMGKCGQRWHYGTRDDQSGKGGATCGGGTSDAGCAWNWYTGLATRWRGGCNQNNAAWMMSGPKANGEKRTAEVWFRQKSKDSIESRQINQFGLLETKV